MSIEKNHEESEERKSFDLWWKNSGFEKFKETAFAAWQASARFFKTSALKEQATCENQMEILSDVPMEETCKSLGLQWFSVAEHGMPDFDEEVIGGFWYTDPWLKPEFATRFMWGLCRVVKDNHRDFKDGKRWYTFGPSHNEITHWAKINLPK